MCLFFITGVERLIDDFRQDTYKGDCPIYYVRDDYVAREVGFSVLLLQFLYMIFVPFLVRFLPHVL